MRYMDYFMDRKAYGVGDYSMEKCAFYVLS